MRKFILVAAIALASASAQAGEIRETRNLTLAASDQAPVETLKAEDKVVDTAKPAEAPKFVDRPSAVGTAAEAPKADVAKPVAAATPKADKPKRRHYWTEARIIGELHRHGIYW
jgi:hypothetical protein